VVAVVELHDRVEVPEVPSVTLVGDNVHVRPEGVTVSVRLTVPVKLFWAVTVIVEVPDAPALTVTLVGLAVTLKVGALVISYVTAAV
jgi:hypothetical protein